MLHRRRLLDLRPLRHAEGALLLVLLFVVDLVILVLHLSLKLFGVPGGEHFDLGLDRSYGEMLMYLKFGWIVILGFMLARIRRAAVFAMLALGSFILLVEDALILHERIGWRLNTLILETMPALEGLGILSVQIGELLWLGGVGVLILVGFIISFRRANARDRKDALSIALFFAVLAFFAVIVDTIHSFFGLGSVGDTIFTVIEDGGELVALTPATALVFALVVTSLREKQKSVSQLSTTISETDLSARRPRQRA